MARATHVKQHRSIAWMVGAFTWFDDIRILTKTGKSLTIVSSIREESVAQSIVVQLKKWLLVSKEFD